MSTRPRRAPRLRPEDRIAPHLRRRGPFARRDPLKARKLPSWSKALGVLGWAALVAGSLYRAWSAARKEPGGP